MRRVKLFIAGSTTEIDRERSFVNNAIVEWNSSNSLSYGHKALEYLPFSYLSFPNVVDPKTGNYKYNSFIKKQCDVIIFILTGDIRKKTLEEFNIAYEGLHGKRHAPMIIVFFDKGDSKESENIGEIRKKLSEHEKYWIYYESPEQLKFLIKEQLTNLAPLFQKRRKIIISNGKLWGIIGIVSLCFLFLFGLESRHKYLLQTVEKDIQYIRTHPGFSGVLRKNKTIQFLEKHSFAERDSLLSVVNNIDI